MDRFRGWLAATPDTPEAEEKQNKSSGGSHQVDDPVDWQAQASQPVNPIKQTGEQWHQSQCGEVAQGNRSAEPLERIIRGFLLPVAPEGHPKDQEQEWQYQQR